MPEAGTEAPTTRPLRPGEICAFIAAAAVNIFVGGRLPLGDLSTRKKHALLVSIGYHDQSNEDWKLNGTHKDVVAMKKLLLDKFGFKEGDITILSDSDEGTTPTRENIIYQLEHQFITPDANAYYFFMYCGHSDQREAPQTNDGNFEEEDNQQEFIIPSDALRVHGDPENPNNFGAAIVDKNTISDVELRELLVDRMGPSGTLVALFDTCHSETILNLRHYRCNRVTSWASSMRRAGRRGIIEPWNKFCHILPRGKLLMVNLDRQQRWTRCNGFCPRAPKNHTPQVICVSACKDRQVTIETQEGGLMTKSIIDLLEKNPTPTLRELARAAKSGADDACRSIKESYKDGNRMDYLLYRLQRIFRPSKVERMPFDVKPSPQISSSVPLNMKARLNIGR